MQLRNSFTVPAAPDDAWATLLDVPRIAPCLPGASLTTFSGDRFDGTVKVRVGPMTMTYRGNGRFLTRDDAAHRAVIEAAGKESRGQGAATATITAELFPDPTGTRVDVVTDLSISGRAAQLGQSMLTEVSTRLITRFATNLATTLTPAPTPTPAADPAAPEPAAEPTAAEPTAAEPAAVPAPAAPSGQGVLAGASASRVSEVEPINLLEVTGVSALARSAVPYAAAFLAGVLLTLLVTWLVTR
jgi:carbon monoxide dehydrogenase subunit G